MPGPFDGGSNRGRCVTGSHGKTQQAWLIGHLLTALGYDPTVMVGGAVELPDGAGGRAGGGEFFVAEADESDGSFARSHRMFMS